MAILIYVFFRKTGNIGKTIILLKKVERKSVTVIKIKYLTVSLSALSVCTWVKINIKEKVR